jgi:hypothetical protein
MDDVSRGMGTALNTLVNPPLALPHRLTIERLAVDPLDRVPLDALDHGAARVHGGVILRVQEGQEKVCEQGTGQVSDNTVSTHS